MTTAHSTRRARSSATRKRTAPSSRTTPPSARDCHPRDGAHVHYSVTIGDGAVLDPDSFLMKGEEVPPYARWGGNPAREMRVPAVRKFAKTATTAGASSGRHQLAHANGERRNDVMEVLAWGSTGGVLAWCAPRGRVHRNPAVEPRSGAGHR